jgi:23S rRNA pseudouridine2604 synthase
VLVDGEVVDEPQFMVQDQVVALAADARLDPIEPATLLWNRTADFVPGSKPWAEFLEPALRSATDATGIRPLRRHFLRLEEVLPPEPGASGLVVLTQDGRLLRRMQEDGAGIEQEYVVEVSGDMAIDGLQRLAHGLRYAGRPLPPAKVSWQSETKLRFALKGVQPRQLAVMCGHVGLQVVACKRLRIGRVSLGPMAPGEWRFLAPGVRFGGCAAFGRRGVAATRGSDRRLFRRRVGAVQRDHQHGSVGHHLADAAGVVVPAPALPGLAARLEQGVVLGGEHDRLADVLEHHFPLVAHGPHDEMQAHRRRWRLGALERRRRHQDRRFGFGARGKVVGHGVVRVALGVLTRREAGGRSSPVANDTPLARSAPASAGDPVLSRRYRIRPRR